MKTKVAADSGVMDHITRPSSLPGNIKLTKENSVRNFVSASGDGIKNHGRANVKLRTKEGTIIGNVFQVAEVCRPLRSVSKICGGASESHHEMRIMQDQAVVVPAGTFAKFTEQADIITTYPRRGWLHVQKVKVRDPNAGANASSPWPGLSR